MRQASSLEPFDAQEQDIAGGELLVDRQTVDEGAVVDALEEDLVGSGKLVVRSM